MPFRKYDVSRLNGATAATTTRLAATNNQPEEENRNLLQVFTDPLVDYGKMAAEGLAQGFRATVNPSFAESAYNKRETARANQRVSEDFKASQDLIRQARQTNDPEERKRLLARSRQLDQTSSGVVRGMTGQADEPTTFFQSEEELGKTPRQIANKGLRKTAGAAAYAVPGGGSLTSSVLGGLASGALTGYAQSDEEKNLPIFDIWSGATIGGVTGAGAYGLQKAGGKLISSVKNKNYGDGKVGQIISKARSGANKTKQEAASAFKSMYQKAFPISRRGRAFEQLRPPQTVSDMMRYGVWGTADNISNKTSMMTGETGVMTNLVNEVIDQSDQSVNLNAVLDAIDEDQLYRSMGKSAGIAKDEVQDEIIRLISSMSPGENPSEVALKSAVDYERKLIKEAIEDLIKGEANQNTRQQALGKIKFYLSNLLSSEIDETVGREAVEEITSDPNIIAFLSDNYSENLVKDFMNVKTLADLRNIQKSFVRMNKIIDLSEEIPATLGRKFFSALAEIPVIGGVFESIVEPLGQAASTGLATGGQRALDTVKRVGTSPAGRAADFTRRQAVRGTGSGAKAAGSAPARNVGTRYLIDTFSRE